MYPRITVNTKKIRHNTGIVVKLCSRQGVSVAGVVKATCGMPEVAKAMLAGGATMLGDSRLENLEKLAPFQVPRLLLRLPMPSRAAEVVQHAEVSLNTETKTVKALGKAALKQKKSHGVILMLELGDLREGLPLDQLSRAVREVMSTGGIRLLGLGTNLTCYGGVLPDPDNLGVLTAAASRVQSEFGIMLDLISGGNSSSVHLLEKGLLPEGINHLRLGESILLGRETAYGETLEGAYGDTFALLAEVIEAREKPSLPQGKRGWDAFGKKPVFQDKGLRKKVILAIGRQDVHPENLTPLEPGVSVLGAGSDHLLLDVTEAKAQYQVGDTAAFRPNYAGLLQLMTSPYVHKELIK